MDHNLVTHKRLIHFKFSIHSFSQQELFFQFPLFFFQFLLLLIIPKKKRDQSAHPKNDYRNISQFSIILQISTDFLSLYSPFRQNQTLWPFPAHFSHSNDENTFFFLFFQYYHLKFIHNLHKTLVTLETHFNRPIPTFLWHPWPTTLSMKRFFHYFLLFPSSFFLLLYCPNTIDSPLFQFT